ncbi:hypothetical protein CALVIDRAFT_600263 [Calocera viscosa TUFC12733]|uniref:Uncharacterized protein n=1 Tax=Calocera viscosa (strain TUFC12733) TaxID=1330018 RepID=A0A167JXE6_CALVF|nr:hypothetical protein CALVIDRAFT_600263 [Calocera viscosa TUFC12733]
MATEPHPPKDDHNAHPSPPNPTVSHDTLFLKPVTHHQIRPIEVEEVRTVRNVERHVHHVVVHYQPVFATAEEAGETAAEEERVSPAPGGRRSTQEHEHYHFARPSNSREAAEAGLAGYLEELRLNDSDTGCRDGTAAADESGYARGRTVRQYEADVVRAMDAPSHQQNAHTEEQAERPAKQPEQAYTPPRPLDLPAGAMPPTSPHHPKESWETSLHSPTSLANSTPPSGSYPIRSQVDDERAHVESSAEHRPSRLPVSEKSLKRKSKLVKTTPPAGSRAIRLSHSADRRRGEGRWVTEEATEEGRRGADDGPAGDEVEEKGRRRWWGRLLRHERTPLEMEGVGGGRERTNLD